MWMVLAVGASSSDECDPDPYFPTPPVRAAPPPPSSAPVRSARFRRRTPSPPPLPFGLSRSQPIPIPGASSRRLSGSSSMEMEEKEKPERRQKRPPEDDEVPEAPVYIPDPVPVTQDLMFSHGWRPGGNTLCRCTYSPKTDARKCLLNVHDVPRGYAECRCEWGCACLQDIINETYDPRLEQFPRSQAWAERAKRNIRDCVCTPACPCRAGRLAQIHRLREAGREPSRRQDPLPCGCPPECPCYVGRGAAYTDHIDISPDLRPPVRPPVRQCYTDHIDISPDLRPPVRRYTSGTGSRTYRGRRPRRLRPQYRTVLWVSTLTATAVGTSCLLITLAILTDDIALKILASVIPFILTTFLVAYLVRLRRRLKSEQTGFPHERTSLIRLENPYDIDYGYY